MPCDLHVDRVARKLKAHHPQANRLANCRGAYCLPARV